VTSGGAAGTTGAGATGGAATFRAAFFFVDFLAACLAGAFFLAGAFLAAFFVVFLATCLADFLAAFLVDFLAATARDFDLEAVFFFEAFLTLLRGPLLFLLPFFAAIPISPFQVDCCPDLSLMFAKITRKTLNGKPSTWTL